MCEWWQVLLFFIVGGAVIWLVLMGILWWKLR